MQKAPLRESFELVEMKTKDRASIEFVGKSSFSDGEATNVISMNDSYPIIPHPDLLEQLDKLKPRLIEFYGYNHFDILVNSKEFSGTAAQKKHAQKLLEEQISNIKITGVAIKKNGVVVKGTYNGSSINTKTVYFTNQEYGTELEENVKKLEDEVFEYVFKGKKAQLELLD